MAKNKPAHEIRLGRIRATIWLNNNGDATPWFNVTIARLYNDGDGWKDSNSFRRDDLPVVAKVADMAFVWIWENRPSAADSNPTTPSPEQTPPSPDEAEF